MKILINPKITICEAVKNKGFGYTILLDSKNPNQLTIKARSFTKKGERGRSRGIAGIISRDGTISISELHQKKLNLLLTNEIRSKINITLDLIFGMERTKSCSLNNKGLVEFKK